MLLTISIISVSIIILLLFSSIMSASETAITSISIVKLKNYINLRKKSKRITKISLLLLSNYNRTLMSILILNTLINAAIATIFTILISLLFIAKLNNATLAIISTVFSTSFILIIGEIIPKIIAKKYSEHYFIRISSFLYFFSILFYPLLWWTKYLQESKNQDHISEDELLELVNIISDNGILEINEKELVKSAIKFDDKKLKNIMINKTKVKFLYHDAKKEDIINFYKKYNYSRVIIKHHISDRISGIIHIKDLLKFFINNKEIKINQLMRQPLFMYSHTSLDDALKIMQEKQNHMIIVISNDKENKFLGIVTFEDLIEQIIGKVYDEYDQPGKIKEIGHSKWIIASDVNMYLFLNKYLKINTENTNKKITILQWFILKNNKIFKKFEELDNKKLIYKNYMFISKIINNETKDIIFEVNLIKNKINKEKK